ncbi:hypothetical protein CALVIDRAFT_361730 [Calocera viscosa TUFC12733]|uniref:Uncharacterized protein n=1 Tax=Calocera viscosa (strain TUFC12733) TaxID=1330018 RepID=A0A167H7J0_CALVF|nr:hypothetical protein CALVIDRAFT_361730 [Calocera viscosa TUFC12733]
MNLLTFVLVLWRLRELLGNISVQQLLEFLAFSRRLQSRIAWQQIMHVGQLDTPPKTPPNTVVVFLANTINASPSQVAGLWNALREVVWLPGFAPAAPSVPLVDEFAPFARLSQSFNLGKPIPLPPAPLSPAPLPPAPLSPTPLSLPSTLEGIDTGNDDHKELVSDQ